ncbi:CCA tRNA nucleotidyltransferase [Prochlorococcus sp. MIT 1341]|uniref:CCA tRNA nucleotidyltransferase n=1 Tax=Prochlorococcus sp. MIT 1341 TaxID=3096221 RepID=UPI002A752651|nr:CCA tRNA nucleotidyltransferase [Prochlorococcus sp. MIT 1341]
MSSPLQAKVILEGDRNILAHKLFKRINPHKWPISIENLPSEAVLVGGAIRDSVLGKSQEKPDLDLIVPKNASVLAREFAIKQKGTFVLLDASRDIARVIIKNWTLDFAAQMSSSLEKDLWRRDYRINAIALSLCDEPRLIDPTGGLEDLAHKKIVAVNEQNLIEDPLRLIRGLRLIAELNLTLEDQTKTWMHKNHAHLEKAAPERISSEIDKLIKAEFFDKIVPLIQELELLKKWQEPQKIIKAESLSNDRCKALTVQEKARALPLARLTSLLSDKGLQLLRFSRVQQERCKRLRYWKQKNTDYAFKNLNENELLKLHEQLEKDLPALIIELSFTEQTTWLKRWRNEKDPLFHPSSPIDGNTLQDCLGVPSGPLLGELIHHLTLEKAFGRLENQQDALLSARYWLKHKQTLL